MNPFPWTAAMQFGLGVLKLNPASFWAMTPRELIAAYRAHNPQSLPLPRARLDEMMTNFPDTEEPHD